MKIRFCCLLLFLYNALVYAQIPDAAYTQYTVSDGLPSSEVYYALQDAKDYL